MYILSCLSELSKPWLSFVHYFFFNDGVGVKAIVHSSNHRIIPTLNAYCVYGSIETLNI